MTGVVVHGDQAYLKVCDDNDRKRLAASRGFMRGVLVMTEDVGRRRFTHMHGNKER